MLAPRGCCSMLLLLLHPSPAKIGASAPCSSSPGSSGAAMPGWCPPGTGREVPGDALSSASVSAAFCCSDLASTPKNGGKKKNHPSQGVPPGPEVELPNPEGNTENLAGAQKAKKPQNPKPQIPGICARAQPALASAQLSSPPARPQLWGRAEVDNANQAGATPKMLRHPKPPPPTPGCFCCLLSSKEKEKQGWAGQYSPQRRELLSSGTEPRCAVGINTSEPQEPQRRIRSKQRP